MRFTPTTDTLFYGDNLAILREHIEDESVDLVYLDPPFNSNATYNVLFRSPAGEQSTAQIEAFEDTWHWNVAAERAFDEVMSSGNTDAAELLRAMRSFLRENDMMAYLTMMAVRLLELHRVLKPTGSLYLHCDPTASHYLKLLLDAVFGTRNYRNEIIWQRTTGHNSARRYGRIHDCILFYSKGERFAWNRLYTPYSEEQLSRYRPDESGRQYKGENLTAERVNSPSGKFMWRGTMPGPTRGWAYEIDQLEAWWDEGRILVKQDGTPRLDGLKVFRDDALGKPLQSLWLDIPRLANTTADRLGYQTQKPVSLLERIIAASSNEGDLVLDPFCGCGTTVHAAEKLNRRWIGIDVTHLAIGLVKRRLVEAFPLAEFEVQGVPKDLGGARELAAADKHQFQLWVLSTIDAQPFRGGRKGADGGVDGHIYFKPDGRSTEKAIVSVKGGQRIGVGMVRELIATIGREGAKIGILVSLEEPTREMVREAVAAGLYKTEHGTFSRIQILTVAAVLGGARPQTPWLDLAGFRRTRREIVDRQGELGI